MNAIADELYGHLRGMAARLMAGERCGHTLDATSLVHEAILKLSSRLKVGGLAREDLIAAAAQAMRRVLVDHARTRNRLKRGGGKAAESELDDVALPVDEPSDVIDVEALQTALDALREVDQDSARIVDLRFFAGLEVDQAAQVMGISPRSAARLWAFARAWLHVRLAKPG
jgi:RNA polymerase sigma factor (TIGR02999 family)